MHHVGLAVARARARRRGLLALGVLVAGSAAAVLGLSLAVDPLLDDAARVAVTARHGEEVAWRVETGIAADPVAQDARVRDGLRPALAGLDATVERSLRADVDAPRGIAGLLVDPGAPERSTLAAGAWPAAADEVTVDARAAEAAGLAPGDRVRLGGAEFVVTGLWSPEVGSPAWFGDPLVLAAREGDAEGAYLVTAEGLAATAPLSGVRARWTIVPDAAALAARPERVRATDGALPVAVSRIAADSAVGVTLAGGAGATAAALLDQRALVRSVAAIPVLLVALAGGIAVLTAARSVATARSRERELMRARGASRAVLAASDVAEAVVVGLLGVTAGALGVAAASGLAVGVGGSGWALPAAAVPLAGGIALVAVGLVAVALAAPARERVRETARLAALRVLTPALPAVALALVAIVPALAGAAAASSASGAAPAALLAPALAVAAVAVAAPALAIPLLALADRLAARRPGLSPVLPVRRVGRRVDAAAAGIVLVAIAAGAVTAALGSAAALGAAQETARARVVGSDLRVSDPSTVFVDAGRPGLDAALLPGDAAAGAVPVVRAGGSVAGLDVAVVAADWDRLAGLPGVDGWAIAGALPPASSGVALSSPATLEVRVDPPPAGARDLELSAWSLDGSGAAHRTVLGVVAAAPPDVAALGDPVVLEADLPAGRLLALEAHAIGAVPDDGPADSPVVLGGLSVAGRELATPAPLEAGSEPVRVPLADGSGPGAASGAATGADRLGAVLDRTLAARLDARPGSTLTLALLGSSRTVEVRSVVDAIPGTARGAIALDLGALGAAAVATGSPVPAAAELWVGTDRVDALAAAVRAASPTRLEIATAPGVARDTLHAPALVLLGLGAVLAAVLAPLGLRAAGGRRESATAARALRSFGLDRVAARRGRALETALVVGSGIVAGIPAGLAAAAVVAALVGAALAGVGR
ncbi:MAG: hypothetical protein J0G30_13060 [Actinomycetales bacterium]|nr:hypothetical protein [Actinomycetales bacterium]